jgi:hypothetical protein
MSKVNAKVWRIAWAVVTKDSGSPVGLYLDRERAREFQRIVAKLKNTRIVRIVIVECP